MQIVRRISNWSEIRDYLNLNLLDKAKEEEAVCAKGRLNLWIPQEPIYGTPSFKPGYRDPRLESFLQKICPECNIFQIFWASNHKAINWHKDASYARNKAYLFNMGNSIFSIQDNKGVVQELELTGGELLTFSCKYRHKATWVDDDRVAIGCWQNVYQR